MGVTGLGAYPMEGWRGPAGVREAVARWLRLVVADASLDKLQCAHDWLTIVPAFSHDAAAEPGEQGDALTVGLYHHRPDQEVYLCGPPPMVAGSRLRPLAAGVPAERIHLPDGFAG